MDLQLNDRVAVVTGAGTGIGFGIALVLAEEGVRVALVGRRQDVLAAAVAKLPTVAGGAHILISQDLRAPGAGVSIATQAIAAAGKVDIIVHNAGVSDPLGVGAPAEAWLNAIALRFHGVRELTEALLPGMKERRYGRVINVGGSWEVQDKINSASVVNAARTVYSKSLSREVGQFGITVNTIGPGVIESEQIARQFPLGPDRDAFIARNIPLGHFGQPRDLAVLVALLASPRGRYITGECIAVDGGMHRFAF